MFEIPAGALCLRFCWTFLCRHGIRFLVGPSYSRMGKRPAFFVLGCHVVNLTPLPSLNQGTASHAKNVYSLPPGPPCSLPIATIIIFLSPIYWFVYPVCIRTFLRRISVFFSYNIRNQGGAKKGKKMTVINDIESHLNETT